MNWQPRPDEAKFIAEMVLIDASLATICADLLRKGQSLASVRDTLATSLKIAAMVHGGSQS